MNNIRNACSNVISSVSSVLSSGSLVSVGQNLLTGLWNGISNKVSWVVGKIKGMGATIMNAIKNVFGVHSPSREWMWVGSMLSEGLAIGITSEADTVTEAVEAIGSIASGTLNSSIAVDNAINSGDSVGEKMINELSNLRNDIKNMKVVLDSGRLVGGIADKVDNALGIMNVDEIRGIA